MLPVTVKFGSTERDTWELAQVVRMRTPVAHPELTEIFLSSASDGYSHTRYIRAPLNDVFNMMAKATEEGGQNAICDLTDEALIKKGFIKPKKEEAADSEAPKKRGFLQRIGLG